jgi:hypothetical protein
MTKGGGEQIGFGEDTSDEICTILNNAETNYFEKWLVLLRRANIGMERWLAGQDEELSLPNTYTDNYANMNVPTLDYLKSKYVADALFFWYKNQHDIGLDMPDYLARYYPDKNLQDVNSMIRTNFGLPPSQSSHHPYPEMNLRVPALLKNKVFTCNSSNGARIISLPVDKTITKPDDQGNLRSVTMAANTPCQFGSEFPKGTFNVNNEFNGCGFDDIFCTGVRTNQPTQGTNYSCLYSCNCDAWPNAYRDVFPTSQTFHSCTTAECINNQRLLNDNDSFHVRNNLSPGINRINDTAYRVCGSNDLYPENGGYKDTSESNCNTRCNCNYTCSMAHAGARYSLCYPEQYPDNLDSGSGELPVYCTEEDDTRCPSGTSCHLPSLSCLTPCESALYNSSCTKNGGVDCTICAGRQQATLRRAGCTDEDIQNFCFTPCHRAMMSRGCENGTNAECLSCARENIDALRLADCSDADIDVFCQSGH